MLSSLEAPGLSYQYADLNIRHTGDDQKTINMVKRAIRMGYDAVAINIDIGDIVPTEFAEDHMLEKKDLEDEPPKKKKKKDAGRKREQTIPDPFVFDTSVLDLSMLEKAGKRFRMYSRITFTLNDAAVLHTVLHNPKLKAFDIVAVRPGDDAIMNTLTRKTDAVDLICYHPDDKKVGWAMKGKMMDMLRVEGVGFEVSYGPALSDRETRRNILSNGRCVIRGLKNKGIVFTSGAEQIIDLRAPVDAMNMLKLWGVEGADARTMISGYPRQVLLRAEARRTIRGVIHVTPITIDEKTEEPVAKVPTRTKSQSDALRRLLTVPSFRAQVEVIKSSET